MTIHHRQERTFGSCYKVWPVIGRDRPTPPIDYTLGNHKSFFFLVRLLKIQPSVTMNPDFLVLLYCRLFIALDSLGVATIWMKFSEPKRAQPNLGDSFKLFCSLNFFFKPRLKLFSNFLISKKGREKCVLLLPYSMASSWYSSYEKKCFSLNFFRWF